MGDLEVTDQSGDRHVVQLRHATHQFDGAHEISG
tara:strand:- start:310 stop:411 length:102 start_codon:yes stop_codon:yes gene_type:complete